MLHVLNEYKEIGDHTMLTIESMYTGRYAVMVDTAIVPHLKQFRWCYEVEKQQVYATDMKRTVTAKLGIKGTRLYLWKYVLWITYDRLANFWHRKAQNDYRVYDSNGICEFKEFTISHGVNKINDGNVAMAGSQGVISSP